MSLTVRIMAALVAGLAGGAFLSTLGAGVAAPVLAIADPVGQLWLHGLQMPLVPLVFGLLVTGIASAALSVQAGGVAARAMALFAGALITSAAFGAAGAEAVLAWWPAPAGGASALTLTSAGVVSTEAIRPSAAWLLGFLPVNPIRAAADSEMVAVVLVALLFGFAAARILPARRVILIDGIQAMVDALLVIVGWVLWLAPVGVFALALMAGYRSGAASAGALPHYVATIVLLCGGVTLLVYPVVLLAGGGILRFMRAAAPAQAIAFSTQSSIASLPSMIAACDGPLAVPVAVRSIVLPLAISLFRVTSPAANIGVAIYIAHLNGIALSPGTMVAGVLVAAFISLAAVGLPSQTTFFTTIGPICLAMGVPVAILPLLLAVETIPDMFRTIGNVTADLAVARIMGRREPGDAP